MTWGWKFSTPKVTSSGGKSWSVLVGTTDTDRGYAVVVDSVHNVYVTGQTGGELPGATALGNIDGFLTKYSQDGVQQWVIQVGTASDHDYAYGLGIDANDKLYPILRLWGTMEGHTKLGSYDIGVLQVDSAGSVQWTDHIGTTGADYVATEGAAGTVTFDSDGNLFLAAGTQGAFTNTVNSGDVDWFLYKMEEKTTTTSGTSTSSTSTSLTSSSTTSTTSSTTSTTGSVTSTTTFSRTLAAVVAKRCEGNGEGKS